MAITREQFKAANARGVAAIARGPVARSARYDSRRRLIVITLEGGCEFAFPAALAEGLADAPRSKLTKIDVESKSTIDIVLSDGTSFTLSATADRIEVQLIYETARVSLRVEDDGRGFTPSANGQPGHYGIRGMRERAGEIDAALVLESTPGEGTRIRVEAPLR